MPPIQVVPYTPPVPAPYPFWIGQEPMPGVMPTVNPPAWLDWPDTALEVTCNNGLLGGSFEVMS